MSGQFRTIPDRKQLPGNGPVRRPDVSLSTSGVTPQRQL